MILTAISIVFTVGVLIIHYQTTQYPPPKFLQVIILDMLGRITCFTSCKKPTSSSSSPIVSPTNGDVTTDDVPNEKTMKHSTITLTSDTHNSDSSVVIKDIRDYLRSISEKNTEDAASGEVEATWKLMARIVDRFLFFVFGIALITNFAIVLNVIMTA